jgi:hypothetical protein
MSDAPAAGRSSRVAWVFAGAMLLWFGAFALAPFRFFAIGVNHYGAWFLDTYAILASNDAVTAGLNPYAPNPLDPFHRPHVYAHGWLHLRDLGLTRLHTIPLGLSVVGAFIVAGLSVLRPRTWREAIGYFFVFGSPPVLLAIDRANNDLVVFLLLLPVVPCLLHESRLVRLFPVFLIAVATALKFYPVVGALVLLLVGETKEVRIRTLIAVLILAAVGVDVVRDLAVVGPGLPRAESLTTFGAINLIEALGLRGLGARIAIVMFIALAAFFGLKSRIFAAVSPAPEDRALWLRFALGAVLLTGCFFAGTNYAYRWVFALWMAPLLWRLPGDERVGTGVRRLARVTRGLLLFALWADPLASALLTRFIGKLSATTITQLADRFFLCEQPVTWVLFGCLLWFCGYFAREGFRRLGRGAA